MSTDKIALVTGANKGIGFETARQLGKQGCRILLGARDEGRGKEAVQTLQKEGIDAQWLSLDVSDTGTIDEAARWIADTHHHLDILVNNAGVFLEHDTLPSQLKLSVLQQTFGVNFFGLFAVTTALLPLLRQSGAGRIVNVSSGQGSLARNSTADSPRLQLAYNSSKAAVNMLTIQLAKELKNTPIKINSAAPGFTVTDMNAGQGKQTVEEAAKIIVHLALLDASGPTGGYFEAAGEVPW